MKQAAELKVSDPQTEASKPTTYITATEARSLAASNFKVAVDTLLNNAIKGGGTKLELNITEVAPEFIAELEKDLEAAGYKHTTSTHVRGANGNTILTVRF